MSEELREIDQVLGARLTRFSGYDERFAAALDRVRQGEFGWVNRPRADSCHTVRMPLHEDGAPSRACFHARSVGTDSIDARHCEM